MPRIKLVTFDLDNTLWEVNPVIIRAEQKMRAYLGDLVHDFDGRFDRHVMLALRNQAIEARPEIRHDLSLTREYVLSLALLEAGFSQSQAETEAAKAFTIFLDARHDVELFADVESTLAKLQQTYQLAALTNGNADVFRLEIGRFFTFQHSSASVSASKPSPEMFEQALRDSQLTPKEVVHVGDNSVDDIEGAQAVGMHTVWVNVLDGLEPPAHSSAQVTRIADLPKAIADLG